MDQSVQSTSGITARTLSLARDCNVFHLAIVPNSFIYATVNRSSNRREYVYCDGFIASLFATAYLERWLPGSLPAFTRHFLLQKKHTIIAL